MVEVQRKEKSMFSDALPGTTEACGHLAVRITNTPFLPGSEEEVSSGTLRHGPTGQVCCQPNNN